MSQPLCPDCPSSNVSLVDETGRSERICQGCLDKRAKLKKPVTRKDLIQAWRSISDSVDAPVREAVERWLDKLTEG